MVSPATQRLVLDGLRVLITTEAAAGRFHAPLVEPAQAWFPDAWIADQEGVTRLLHRIMTHAGLASVPLSVERFVLGANAEDDAATRHVIAVYKGRNDGRCDFGVNCAQLDDPERLIGVLAHEVAHAFRDLNGLVVEDRDDEEELTDLTTIFLGFGIFTTNNAHRESVYSSWRSVQRAGYLSAHAMVFALAVWVRAREANADLEALERWLEPLQRSLFAKTLSELRKYSLHDLLEIDGTPSRPRGRAVPDSVAVGRAAGEPIDFAAKRSDTFRVTVRPWPLTTGVGLVLGGIIGWGETQHMGWAFFGALVLGAIGFVVGRLAAHHACARRECEAQIPRNAVNCPRCGAMVQGELRDPAQAPAAFETLRRKRAEARRTRDGNAPSPLATTADE